MFKITGIKKKFKCGYLKVNKNFYYNTYMTINFYLKNLANMVLLIQQLYFKILLNIKKKTRNIKGKFSFNKYISYNLLSLSLIQTRFVIATKKFDTRNYGFY